MKRVRDRLLGRPGNRRRSARRMSRRGRSTLFALAALGAFACGYWLHDSLPGLAGSRAGDGAALPPVSSRPVDAKPPIAVAVQDRVAPRRVVEHLPVGVSDHRRAHVEPVPLSSASREPIVHEIDGHLVEYSFDRPLTGRVMRRLKRGRVQRGHVIVLDPRTGRVLAYVSTDTEAFPPQNHYPAASLVKIVTAAAALHHTPSAARRPCLYRGNRYRLTRSRVHRPSRGNQSTLERALATSNNQCFAQLAVDSLGQDTMVGAIESFGWLDPPAPGHAAGHIDPGDDDYDLGRLGCGLRGCRITPLHAARLAATLVNGEQVTPWWVDRVSTADGGTLALPERPAPKRVIPAELAAELRSMLIRTTTHGTARSAFRDRRGRPKLRTIRVAGKTGNLTGSSPRGRYEWFVGVAPATRPTIAVAVLQLQSNLWWSKSSEIAADVLEEIFCDRGRCDPTLAHRFTGDLGQTVRPVLLSGSNPSPEPEDAEDG